jgi:hypothetical protein
VGGTGGDNSIIARRSVLRASHLCQPLLADGRCENDSCSLVCRWGMVKLNHLVFGRRCVFCAALPPFAVSEVPTRANTAFQWDRSAHRTTFGHRRRLVHRLRRFRAVGRGFSRSFFSGSFALLRCLAAAAARQETAQETHQRHGTYFRWSVGGGEQISANLAVAA